MPYERKFKCLKLSVSIEEKCTSMFYSCVFCAKMNMEGVLGRIWEELLVHGIGLNSMNIWWNGPKFRVNIANKRIHVFSLERFYEKCIFR